MGKQPLPPTGQNARNTQLFRYQTINIYLSYLTSHTDTHWPVSYTHLDVYKRQECTYKDIYLANYILLARY